MAAIGPQETGLEEDRLRGRSGPGQGERRVAILGVDQVREKPSGQLIGVIAEAFFPRRIRGPDPAVATEDGEEGRGVAEELFESLPGPAELAHVADHDQPKRLGTGMNPAHAHIDREGVAALAGQGVPFAGMKILRFLQGVDQALETVALGREQVLNPQREHVASIEAGHPQACGVDVNNTTVPRVEDEEGVTGLAEDRAGDLEATRGVHGPHLRVTSGWRPAERLPAGRGNHTSSIGNLLARPGDSPTGSRRAVGCPTSRLAGYARALPTGPWDR